MPLTSILPYLQRAQQEKYAIPLFDLFDSNAVDGTFQALEELRAPGIAALYSNQLGKTNTAALTAYLRARAEQSQVPISIMLDHGASFEQCMQAIRLGFTDVMFDGSKLPLEDNIAITKAVARAAHAVGVGVEAELGQVGMGSDYQEIYGKRKGYTDPAAVEKFVAETGVDMLAIAIGNAHGVYQGEPNIDLNLLAEIRRRVETPLVLHGGSGISEAQFRAAVQGGICKINIATDLYLEAGKNVAAAAAKGAKSYFELMPLVLTAFRQRCGYHIELFGANGKA